MPEPRSSCRKALILDPNLFLAALHRDDDSVWLIESILENWDFVHFVLDTPHARPRDLAASALYQQYRELLKAHPGTRVELWLKQLFERVRQNDLGVLYRRASLNAVQETIVQGNGCGNPVEPEMLAMGANVALRAWVCVVGERSGSRYSSPLPWRVRGVDDAAKCAALEAMPEFRHLDVRTAGDAFAELTHWRHQALTYLYPRTPRELAKFVHHTCGNHESQVVEFKQPNSRPHVKDALGYPGPFLTWEIMDSAMESVCAMANAQGGTVLIGVKDNGRIVGFVPMYGRPQRNWVDQSAIPGREPVTPCSYDRLYDIVRGSLKKIWPKLDLSNDVRFEFISLGNDRVVIVIQVALAATKKRGVTYSYQPVIFKGKFNKDGVTFAYRRVGVSDEKGNPVSRPPRLRGRPVPMSSRAPKHIRKRLGVS